MAINPIAFTERVVEDFLHYQLTTYPFADRDLYDQLKALLRLDDSRETPLRKGPFISLSRPFKQGSSIQKLVADGIFHPGMVSVVPSEFTHVRAHQDEAMRAIHAGRTTIVSTGTGSGKTEAFLYPIISRCLALKESNAPAGLVAVLIYPMNALAEDQLERMRGLLAGRGVSFGMYVGKTPKTGSEVRGKRLPAGTTNADYHAHLRKLRENGQTTTLLPPEERASRESMQKDGGQPRILLTNVKQLELLLTRENDVGIFANAPLEFLVFDEAHTFRGAQGAETACLVRRLRTFCGKNADEVRHVATSATMAGPTGSSEPAEAFARRFFGVDGNKVTLVREAHDEQRWNEQRAVPAGPPDDPQAVLTQLLAAVDAPIHVSAELSACLLALGGARLPKEGWQAALASQLASNELVYHLAEHLKVPMALADLPALLEADVVRPVPEAEILSWLVLGAASGRDGHDPFLRPVAHTFVRGVSGAVVTFSLPSAQARLWLSAQDAESEADGSFRRFPVLTCTSCGQHYYETKVQGFTLAPGKQGASGGVQLGQQRMWPAPAEGDKLTRVLFVDRLVVQTDETDDDDEAEDEAASPAKSAFSAPSGHDFEHRRLFPLVICAKCGGLHDANAQACLACAEPTPMVPIQAVRTKETSEGVLDSCVACRSAARRPGGGAYREPARPVRAVGVSDVHVLAQSMINLSERQRLLVFADNRQDAAFQAGWMRDHSRRFRLRNLLAQQIGAEGTSVADIVNGLDAMMESDRDLSLALLPEVWHVEPIDDNSSKHRDDRKFFLRVQVLREIAMGLKQRLGLEPWGRIRVDYLGLSSTLPVVQTWAPLLHCTAEALTEGIAALLDHMRRTRLLHDKSKLFQKQWSTSDSEVLNGYVPTFPGGPKGVKISRDPDDAPARVAQWHGTRPTQVSNAVLAWGVASSEFSAFFKQVWDTLEQAGILVVSPLTGYRNLPAKGAAGAYQIDTAKLLIHRQDGRFRCQKCRRTTARQGPTARCMGWRCGGTLVWEVETGEDFNLRMLDGNYDMLRVAEHSAQVPTVRREEIENLFKGKSDKLNTLVCTPTLELGVDIGALDAVLMRNVPPAAANYWQRAGRAGRRHRMAVDVTYAQATGFDQSYFREPLKLLRGQVEPPRFNLKNMAMVQKHVHAAVLTTLLGLARGPSSTDAATIRSVLALCFPTTLGGYLFDTDGRILPKAIDVSPLGGLVATHSHAIHADLARSFTATWPLEDAEAVPSNVINAIAAQMHHTLAEVVARFKRRLDWAMGERARLEQIRKEFGDLKPDEEGHDKRCKKVIQRLKGTFSKGKGQAQGGDDDSETMGALARQGFLPGYGLESGSIVGFAEPPRMTVGLDEFELPRPPTLALREFVPGNAIYANGFRFVPRHFLRSPDDTLRFRVVPETQVVEPVGADSASAPLQTQEIRAVRVCDVAMPSQSQISDDEEFRFQMSVAVYGNDKGYHRGGFAWTWGGMDIRFRRGAQLTLVNAGPKSEVEEQRLGYPLCLGCGQSLSPFAGKEARKKFDDFHAERCKQPVRPTGFYAHVEVDVLGLHNVPDRTVGFSVAEALRMGAARVLDMEVEDLQILALGRAGESGVDLLLYDPMPGGSGLLEQLAERWEEVCAAALILLDGCVGACQTSCIDCLQTYRNRFYHPFLDRHKAAGALRVGSGPLLLLNPLGDHLPALTSPPTQGKLELNLRHAIVAAGLPLPLGQKEIKLGGGLGHTRPDFFYDDPEGGPGICVYADGMSVNLHGNPEQAAKDLQIRQTLEGLGYEVVVVPSFMGENKAAVVNVIAKIAGLVYGKAKQKNLKANSGWFDLALGLSEPGLAADVLQMVACNGEDYGAIPLYDLKVAAGAFSSGQAPEAIGFVYAVGRAGRPGEFIAKVIGNSMDKVAAKGAWCLWQHLGGAGVAAASPGEDILVRRPDGADPDLGQFTFKRLLETSEGRRLAPVSTDPAHQPILLSEADELEATARFVAVVSVAGLD